MSASRTGCYLIQNVGATCPAISDCVVSGNTLWLVMQPSRHSICPTLVKEAYILGAHHNQVRVAVLRVRHQIIDIAPTLDRRML